MVAAKSCQNFDMKFNIKYLMQTPKFSEDRIVIEDESFEQGIGSPQLMNNGQSGDTIPDPGQLSSTASKEPLMRPGKIIAIPTVPGLVDEKKPKLWRRLAAKASGFFSTQGKVSKG
jgi:hypothetical protein